MIKLRHIGGMLLAAPVLWACTDDSYRGYEKSYEEYDIPMEVKVSVGDPYAMGSKGSGPIETLDGFAGKQIHVWAFNRNEETSFTSTRTAKDSIQCLADGKIALLDGTNALAEWEDTPVYYPLGDLCAERFDFFAAFLDGSDIEHVQRSPSRVRTYITIDGSQDVMYSKADLPKMKSGADKPYAFSYLSAIDGNDPVFTMHHALVCVDLWVMPGITKDFTNKVVINSAALNARTRVLLTVADKDPEGLGASFDENGAKDFLLLTEEDGSPLQPVELTTLQGDPYDEALRSEQQRQATKLGASFFVSPETLYKLRMDIQPVDGEPDRPARAPVEADVKLLSGQSFLCGNRYRVVMSIFGEYAVVNQVSMIDWEDAGSFLIDQDQIPSD